MIILPFPPKILSPNARPHWAALAKAKKLYRRDCFLDARIQGVKTLKDVQTLNVHLVFFPPDRRPRDADNMLAAMKSGNDGLADALGVDDSKWKLSFSVSSEIGNKVSVSITPG